MARRASAQRDTSSRCRRAASRSSRDDPGSVRFVERAEAIAARYGKRVIGWEEIGRADLRRATVVQHWHGNDAAAASRRGAKVMLFPRLIGITEIAWFPKSDCSWSEYRVRLGARADRLAALGIGFYRSPEVPWR
jgi:N-acetyl-beta-hexosaminidase